MSQPLIIDLVDLRAHLAWRRALNRADLKDVVWTDGGKPITPTSEELDQWRFMGVTNLDFGQLILMERDQTSSLT